MIAAKSQRAYLSSLIYISLLLWVVICIFPFLWTFLTSVKETRDAFASPPVWRFVPTFEHYVILWLEEGFWTFFINSMIVTLGTVVVSITIGCFAGYALARYSGAVGFWLLFFALIFRALPRMVFVIPFFHISRISGLYDTHLILILVMVAMNQPFTIWMLRSFFMSIPKDLEESAMVDGCSRFKAFIKVIVPVMWPGVISTALFTFLLAYNEFLMPLILTATNASTMPVAISQFGAEDIRYWSVTAAGAISITLPIVVVILFFQRNIVSGLVQGAVKG